MSNIFFTSDTHFLHENIIRYCRRPFNSVEEQTEFLISAWNSVVKTKNDVVYHLGDFGFWKGKDTLYEMEQIFKRLNGSKFFIKGNHDTRELRAFEWDGVYDYKEIKHDKIKFCLFHYPIEEWNSANHGAIHLHGHQHNSKASNSQYKMFDVGVDAWEYQPVSIDTIILLANTKIDKRHY